MKKLEASKLYVDSISILRDGQEIHRMALILVTVKT